MAKALTRYLVKTAKGYVTKDDGVYTDDEDEAKQFEDPAEAQTDADEEDKEAPEGSDPSQVEEVEVEDPDAPPAPKAKDESLPEEDEAFVPKPSAKHAAMLHQNAQDEDQYITSALKDMDHPGMAGDIQKYHAKFVAPRMQHLKDMLHKHHGDEGSDPDSFMEKVCKGMESDGAGPTTETGEAELVDQGQLPPDSVSDGGADSSKNAPVESDTEEINERYQDPETKRWFTKTIATVRRGLNNRLYVVKGGSKLRQKDFPPDKANRDQDVTASPIGKQFDDDDVEAVKDASEYMGDASNDQDVPKAHRSALKSHGKRLGQVHKSLTEAGKIQADGGRGKPLTEAGKVQRDGGKGSTLNDKGENQTSSGTPGSEVITGSGKVSFEGGTKDITQLKDWERDMLKSMEALQKEKEETRKVAGWVGLLNN